MKVSPRSLGSSSFLHGKLLSAGREQRASYAPPGVIRDRTQVSSSILEEDRPRGHSQRGLGLLPKKASNSLWEGFPHSRMEGVVRRCETAHPCSATSLLSRSLSCRLEIRSLHNQVMQRGAFPMGDKVPPSWGLALLQAGSIFQRSQFCPRPDWDIPTSPGKVSLFLTSRWHEPQ